MAISTMPLDRSTSVLGSASEATEGLQLSGSVAGQSRLVQQLYRGGLRPTIRNCFPPLAPPRPW